MVKNETNSHSAHSFLSNKYLPAENTVLSVRPDLFAVRGGSADQIRGLKGRIFIDPPDFALSSVFGEIRV